MQQSPSWEANSRSPSQEIYSLIWNPKMPILSQINPVYVLSPYTPKIHCDTFSFTPTSSDHNFVCTSLLSHPSYMPRPSHPPWCDHHNVWWSRRQCVTSRNMLVYFYDEKLLSPAHHPIWRTTHCRLSATAYSTYSHLTSTSGGLHLHLQPEEAPRRGDKGPT